MQAFRKIYERALDRKGGVEALSQLLPVVLSRDELAAIPDSRYLSMIAKGINQAGFNWQVIENKWSQFEEAFFGFDVEKLALLPDTVWDAYLFDTRVVRNWQKIEAVYKNAVFLRELAEEHGSAAHFFANWDEQDQLGLLRYLKKHGSRLGGMTGRYFLRRMGKDMYLLSRDVILALQHAGLDIADEPSSQKDLKRIQSCFDQWHVETNLPYSHLSKIAAYSVGENYPADYVVERMGAHD
ncbi:DNA-3-methyladenine glycosylase I [Aquirhabdus sp.]|uniref:DNA-3-methyladenine glycosylase I n=1 Tax=Aquirhabdus sp. TaxID=2824160 RepID=UPI00396C507C